MRALSLTAITRITSWAVGHFLSIVCCAAIAQAGTPTIIGIGVPPGFVATGFSVISGDGSTVVGMAIYAGTDYRSRGYRFTEASGFELLDLPPGFTQSTAGELTPSCSFNGMIIAGSVFNDLKDPSNDVAAIRWVNGVPELLQVPSSTSSSKAYHCSDSGDLVGGYVASG